MKRVIFLMICALAPLATLRWPWPIVLATARGEGAFDRTIFAFLAPFVLILLGYPGFLAAAWSVPGRSSARRLWFRASVLLVLTSAVLVLVWMAPTVLQMVSTLRNPWSNLVWLTPPIATIVASLVVRLGPLR